MNTPDDPVHLHRHLRVPRAAFRPDPVLDELACAAAARTDCRFALIRISDDDGAAFSGSHGIDEDWLTDALDLCAAPADEQALFEVADAARHPRLRDEPLVCDEPRVRQYVGVPLQLDGRTVGALCVFDARARVLGAGPRAALRALASAVQHWLVGRRAVARLHDSRRFLASLGAQVPGAFLQLDVGAKGQASVAYASEGVREIFECSPQDVSQRLMVERIHPDDRARIREAVERSSRQQTALVQECRVCLPQRGTRWIEGRATPERRDGGRVVWSGFIHDVTERHELQQLRREKLERRRSDRATRELVSTLSHELRTPLNAVLGFTQLMQADPQLPARTQTQLGHIQTASQQLLALVNDVLERARGEHTRQSVQLGPVPLQPVLEASLALIDPQAKLRGVQIEPVRGPVDLRLRADARALGQVLLNLLSNAVKYNRDGGRAWVEVIDDGAQIGVAVCDEGKGLSAAMMQRLFRPFDRLGEEAGQIAGSGLGLVISRQLVEAMHGRLEVRSVGDGGGSRFIVWLARA